MCQEAEAAREKLSSPQGVTAFIIITNLQAPPEPTGARVAAKRALQILGFHISPQCIRRLEGAFLAGHTHTHEGLFIGLYFATVFIPQDWGGGED